MNQDDYIKQLEESNRKLQDKLEASEKKHDDFLDKPVYIYMDGNSRSFDNLSLTDKNGVFEGDLRIVTSMRYIQQGDRMYGDEGLYEQTWSSDGKGGLQWVTPPSLNLNISSQTIKSKARKLKMKWTADAVEDFKSIGNLEGMGLSGITEDIWKEVEKFTNPITKPTAKEISKYGKKKRRN